MNAWNDAGASRVLTRRERFGLALLAFCDSITLSGLPGRYPVDGFRAIRAALRAAWTTWKETRT